MGFTPQEADAVFFHTRVLGDGKAEGQLETVQEQIGLIAAMGESKSEFILLSFRNERRYRRYDRCLGFG